MLVCYMSWSLWCWFGLCVQSYKHDLHLALNRTRSYRNQYSQILYTGTKLQPASQGITKSQPGRTILQLSAFCWPNSQHLPDRSWVTSSTSRGKPSYSHHPTDRAMQVAATSFRQEPSHSLHSPDRAMQVTASIIQTEPCKLQPAPLDRSQVTACILQTEPCKLQPASSRQSHSSHSLYPSDRACKSQPVSSRWKPNYSLHSPDPLNGSQDTGLGLEAEA